MGSLVRLLSTLTVISLLTPSSEGVKCYECELPCEKGPGKAVECKNHCIEGVATENNGPPMIARGCDRSDKDPASGCEPFIEKGTDKKPEVKGEICGCNQDLCNLNLIGKTGGKKNGSYALSYQWISLPASALIAINVNIFSCQ